MLVDSMGPAPSQVTSTVTARPSRVVKVPVAVASCSDGEKVNSEVPVPRSLMRLKSQSKPWIRTVRKSLSSVVSPDSVSSSWPGTRTSATAAKALLTS